MRFSAKDGVQKSPKLAKTVQDCPKLSGAVQKSPKLSSSALCFRHSGVLGENFCCEALPTSPGLRRPSEYLHRRKSYPATLFLMSKWSAERCEIPCLREIVRDRAISGENMRHCAKSRGFMRLRAIFGEELSPEQSKPVQKSPRESRSVQPCPKLSNSG